MIGVCDEDQIPSTLRVFEIEGVDVELPCVLARRHQYGFVGFDNDDELLGRARAGRKLGFV